MTTFGTELRRARVAAGVTQAQLGEPQFSRSYVSLLESGARQPTTDVMAHFASKLGLSLGDLRAWARSESDASELAGVAIQIEALFRLAKVSRFDARQVVMQLRALDPGEGTGMGELLRHLLTLFVDDVGVVERLSALAVLAEHRVVNGRASLYAEILERRCFLLRSSGRLEECVALAREGLATLQEMPNGTSWLTIALYPLVSALAELGLEREAFEAADQLAEAVDCTARPIDEGLARWALGNVLIMSGRGLDGVAQHDRAAELLDPNTYLRTWARLQRASASMRVDYGVAVETVPDLLDKAGRAFSITADAADIVELDTVRAQYLMAMQRWEEAAELLAAVLAVSAERLAPQSLAELHERYGTTLAKLGDRDAAVAQIREAVRLFQQVGAYERALTVCAEWGVAPERANS